MEISSDPNEIEDSGSSLAKNLNPERYKQKYGKKHLSSKKKAKHVKTKSSEPIEEVLEEPSSEPVASSTESKETAKMPLQESIEEVIRYVALMEEEEEKKPQRFTRKVEEPEEQDSYAVFREAKRNVDRMQREEAERLAKKKEEDEELFSEVERNLNKRIDEEYKRIKREEAEEKRRLDQERKEELDRRERARKEAKQAEKERREKDKKKAALVKKIQKNVERNIKAEDKEIKRTARKDARRKKIEQKKIKKWRSRYFPHKERSFLERFAHMIYYNHGGYDKYIFTDYNDLSKRQQKKWQTKIEAIEDTEHDLAMRRGWTSFKVLLATLGIVLTCQSVKLVYTQFQETMDRLAIERVIKEKEYSETVAKSKFFKLEDQEYLKSKLDIPEGASEEEILAIMNEAYANLKPEVKQWIRDPQRVADSEARRREKEKQNSPNSESLIAKEDTEIGE